MTFFGATYARFPCMIAHGVPPEPLWFSRADNQVWSCELVDHGRGGVEAQILLKGQPLMGRLFDTRRRAIGWAERERRGLLGLPESPKYGFPAGGTFAMVAAVVIALIVTAPWVGLAHQVTQR